MISACMAVSVRELRTAVREWACCQSLILLRLLGVDLFLKTFFTLFNSVFFSFTSSFIHSGCLRLPLGAQWFSGRVLDSRPKGRGFEPQRCQCIVVLEQDTFILA